VDELTLPNEARLRSHRIVAVKLYLSPASRDVKRWLIVMLSLVSPGPRIIGEDSAVKEEEPLTAAIRILTARKFPPLGLVTIAVHV